MKPVLRRGAKEKLSFISEEPPMNEDYLKMRANPFPILLVENTEENARIHFKPGFWFLKILRSERNKD